MSAEKHSHADGTHHDNHPVAQNDWGNPEPHGWPPETLHIGPAKHSPVVDDLYD